MVRVFDFQCFLLCVRVCGASRCMRIRVLMMKTWVARDCSAFCCRLKSFRCHKVIQSLGRSPTDLRVELMHSALSLSLSSKLLQNNAFEAQFTRNRSFSLRSQSNRWLTLEI